MYNQSLLENQHIVSTNNINDLNLDNILSKMLCKSSSLFMSYNKTVSDLKSIYFFIFLIFNLKKENHTLTCKI